METHDRKVICNAAQGHSMEELDKGHLGKSIE